jgi:glycerol-3-phosphate responsive antiterminator
VLVSHTTIHELVAMAPASGAGFAMDLDSIEGLQPDEAGVGFAVDVLRAGAVISRRPPAVAAASAWGALGLLRIFALDSTGFRRAIRGLSEVPGAAVALSPGPILAHLDTADRAALPRPLLVIGLIHTAADIAAARRAGATSVAVDRADLSTLAAPLQRLSTARLDEPDQRDYVRRDRHVRDRS